MPPQRRTVLRLAGLGAVTTLAGCLGPSAPGSEDGSDDGTTDGSENALTVDTQQFVTHGSRPDWDTEDAVGRVVLIDSEERRRAVLSPYEAPDKRSDELEEFLDGVEYDSERLLFVESVGPDACHDRVELTNVRLSGGQLRADAAVTDTSDGGVACAEVISYPSAIARISFGAETDPANSAAVEITDGWEETATVSASVDDSLGSDVGSLDGSIRPDTEADPIESLECDRSNVHRHQQAFDEDDLVWGDVGRDGRVTLGLRIDDTELGYGDTARLRLTNVADEVVHTGNRAKYNVQAYTENGWQDVRVADEGDPFEYTDEAIGHAPGEGFEWSFELTESGLTEGTYHDHAEVCPDLAAGRYRFAYWGVTDGADAVAVAFDLRR
jgi:hypothetical protein